MNLDYDPAAELQFRFPTRLRRFSAALPEFALAAGFLYGAMTADAPLQMVRELNNSLTGELIAIFTFPFIASVFLLNGVIDRTILVFVALAFAVGFAGAAGDFRILAEAVVMFAVTYLGFFAIDLRDKDKQHRVILTGARWLTSAALYPGAIAAAPLLAKVFTLQHSQSPRMLQGFVLFTALALCEVFGVYPRVARRWQTVVSETATPE